MDTVEQITNRLRWQSFILNPEMRQSMRADFRDARAMLWDFTHEGYDRHGALSVVAHAERELEEALKAWANYNSRQAFPQEGEPTSGPLALRIHEARAKLIVVKEEAEALHKMVAELDKAEVKKKVVRIRPQKVRELLSGKGGRCPRCGKDESITTFDGRPVCQRRFQDMGEDMSWHPLAGHPAFEKIKAAETVDEYRAIVLPIRKELLAAEAKAEAKKAERERPRRRGASV